jgi:hypothetical protein
MHSSWDLAAVEQHICEVEQRISRCEWLIERSYDRNGHGRPRASVITRLPSLGSDHSDDCHEDMPLARRDSTDDPA